jgi:Phospholipase_D-nuclease N-terminal
VEISLDTHSMALAVAGLAVGFVVFCLVDLVRAQQVRYLPKWAWAILCLGIGLTIPFGGILYLVIGKDRSPKSSLVPELSSAS